MDSLISAAARALAGGDVLAALQHVSLRDDPPALALRGIAMAQLGEHARARELLRHAARGFGAHEAQARARCVVAEAEVALAMRDFSAAPGPLAAALAVLETHEDHANALLARLIVARRHLLLGRLHDADTALAGLAARPMPAPLAAMAGLCAAELALRSLRIAEGRAALERARQAAEQARIAPLLGEVTAAQEALSRPAARLGRHGGQVLDLGQVAQLLDSGVLVLDACRRGVSAGGEWRALARRPILFALARALAEAWPGDVAREALIASVFRTARPDDTHRARLRVEIGRLRALLKGLARIEATAHGYTLRPEGVEGVAVLAPPVDGEQAALQALLGDGLAWSTSGLALALDASQRTVQRALAELEAQGKVRAIGHARARRWLAPLLAGYTTILLLPATLRIP
ncbi:helix-turn-helix domain-containing protein [Oxalobacteraceae bacterium A2-2]